MPTPQLGRGEVRIRVASSGVNPGDVKKRQDAFGIGMAHRTCEVHMSESGDLRWRYEQDGQEIVFDKEPQTTRDRCFSANLSKLLPVRGQL